jgi:hypothetical protein
MGDGLAARDCTDRAEGVQPQVSGYGVGLVQQDQSRLVVDRVAQLRAQLLLGDAGVVGDDPAEQALVLRVVGWACPARRLDISSFLSRE